MKFIDVPARRFASIDELQQALAKIRRHCEVVRPLDLTFHDEGTLSLGSESYAITQTGAKSLLAMLDIPFQFVTATCPPDLAEHIVNDLLHRMSGPVEVCLRDDVVTSVHDEPGPQFWYSELIDQYGDALRQAVRVELTEERLRVATRGSKTIKLPSDDSIELGHDLSYSEDFGPLRSSTSLFRQVCSNGATITLRSHSFIANLRKIGLAETLFGFRRHLNAVIDVAEPKRILAIAMQIRSTNWERTRAEIRRVVKEKIFERHPEFLDIRPNVSAYQVFNIISATARNETIVERQRLERLAGDFLLTIAATNGDVKTAWRRDQLSMDRAASGSRN